MHRIDAGKRQSDERMTRLVIGDDLALLRVEEPVALLEPRDDAFDGVVEILEGLSAGETVVSRAGTFLRDGDSVTPIASASIGGENG